MSSLRRKARGGAGGKITALPPSSPHIFPCTPSDQSSSFVQDRPSLRKPTISASFPHQNLPYRVPLAEKSPNVNLLKSNPMPLPRRVPGKVPSSLDREDPAKRHRAVSQHSLKDASLSALQVNKSEAFQVVGKVQVSTLKTSSTQLLSQKTIMEENANCHIMSSERSARDKLHFVPKMAFSTVSLVQEDNLQNNFCQFSSSSARKRIHVHEEGHSLSSASNSPYLRSSVEFTAQKEILDSTYTRKLQNHISPSFYSSQQERTVSFPRNLCSAFDRNDMRVNGSSESLQKKTNHGVLQISTDDLYRRVPKYTSQKNLSVIFNDGATLHSDNGRLHSDNGENGCRMLNYNENKDYCSAYVGNNNSAFGSSPVSVLVSENSNGLGTPSSYTDDSIISHEEKINCADIDYNVEGLVCDGKQTWSYSESESTNDFLVDYSHGKTSRYNFGRFTRDEEHNSDAEKIYSVENLSCHFKTSFSSNVEMLVDQNKKAAAGITLQDRLLLLQQKVSHTIGRSKENKCFLDSNLRSHAVLLSQINTKLNMIENLMGGLTICQ